ncbi:hypothetical protein QQF64_036441 [Cirrhinus molitorella]|uniref:Uncharacterized protein n=1 Tax=Cirrhinus molitorella TaxID=172907 RepID=A0ABR3NJG1_9TELE
MAERFQNTSDLFTLLGGRGRGLYRVGDSTGAIPKLLFPSTPSAPEVRPLPGLAQPACSTPSDSNNNVTQQLRELIGELGNQIGDSIVSRLLASQNAASPSPTTASGLHRSEPSIESSKVGFIVRSDIKEPPMFRGDESDKYTVQE